MVKSFLPRSSAIEEKLAHLYILDSRLSQPVNQGTIWKTKLKSMEDLIETLWVRLRKQILNNGCPI